jgi:hypothetical protein
VPKSVTNAVCAVHHRAGAVTMYMGCEYGSLRLHPRQALQDAAGGAASSSVPSMGQHLMPFWYDSPALACIRRFWSGFGGVTGLIEVLKRWLPPLLQRVHNQNDRQEVPDATSIYQQCFVGMTMLPPCMATHGARASTPWILAHVRPTRRSPFCFAWSIVDDGRKMNEQVGISDAA